MQIGSNEKSKSLNNYTFARNGSLVRIAALYGDIFLKRVVDYLNKQVRVMSNGVCGGYDDVELHKII
jgi:hypothetical protein